jgi:4-hydroxy-2-oxovalerate aldolase
VNTNAPSHSLTLVDTSLRDGMHTMSHQFTPVQVAEIATRLDRGGIDIIEVAHGDGLGGSSIQYGFAAASDGEYVEAAIGAVERARIAVLLLPGIGTLSNLRCAQRLGATVARIATHCTEADISREHMEWAKEAGMEVIGFLMMSHMSEPAALAEQAALMESYGADVVYIVDSAGAMVPTTAAERVAALRDRLDIVVGFHAHNNLGCAVGNSLAALAVGAEYVDGSLRGLGAGAGNCQTEALAAALDRSGYETRADVFELMDASEDLIAGLMPKPQVIDRTSLMCGFAGVYSSFVLHAERAAARYDVDVRDILMELGRRGIVGGQEDLIIEVAAEMAASSTPRSASKN